MQNPFLSYFENFEKNKFLPFQQIKPEHFVPALETAIAQAKSEIAKIKANPQTPTFENTILPLETSVDLMNIVVKCFGNLFIAEGTESIRPLAAKMYPMASACGTEIFLDSELFAKVKMIYDNPARSSNAEDLKLVEYYFKAFENNGATLSPDKKKRMMEINETLATLVPRFSDNVLKATNAFELWITDKKDLDGLPPSAIDAAALEAKNKGKDGQWFFSLQMPSYLAVVKYLKNREIRKKMYLAYASLCVEGELSNKSVIKEIIELRYERAQLLGYKNFAELTLKDRMAQKPAEVSNFLARLLKVAKPAAEHDIKAVREFAKKTDGLSEIFAWDFSYYSEKLMEAEYSFNQEELKPYFPLDQVMAGMFEHAKRLFNLNFEKVQDVPTYHPDVEVFLARDATTHKEIGHLMIDLFPRDTKRNGAWMTVFLEQGYWKGKVRRPVISIVCNFSKPTSNAPSLLTMTEVATLFHEFGHALHGLLSDCKYISLAGANVYWDFVELPSQLMENWTQEKEALDLFAKHYVTGEPIPQMLVDRMLKARNFQSGYMCMRQVRVAQLDMSWHTTDPKNIGEVEAFEAEVTKNTQMFPWVPGTAMSHSFSHIFAGGYEAGYYSYKWAEVLDADAFEFFKEQGLFNAAAGAKFKENILSRGGTDHPMNLYKKFRGREPDPDALLRRDGLI